MPDGLRITVVTIIPSPYQVELFNALAAAGRFAIRAIYDRHSLADRHWGPVAIAHDHAVMSDGPSQQALARSWSEDSDLVIFSFYGSRAVRRMLRRRAASGRHWCFWGERPGYHRFGRLGAWYRRWRLPDLYRSRVPIWGMGQWAVEGYRQELGEDRPYFNVPYFSDLSRFSPGTERRRDGQELRFLYLGSLIPRKGVDLLAQAFPALLRKYPNVHLDVVGTGPCQGRMEEELQGCEGHVRFLGFSEWQDLPKVYSRVHVLCVPSRYDGWGMIVPEGLAAGLPVISTDQTGAAREFIRPGTNGWLARAGDLESLNGVLRETAELSPEEWQRCSRAAQASVAAHSLADGVQTWTRAALASLKSEPEA